MLGLWVFCKGERIIGQITKKTLLRHFILISFLRQLYTTLLLFVKIAISRWKTSLSDLQLQWMLSAALFGSHILLLENAKSASYLMKIRTSEEEKFQKKNSGLANQVSQRSNSGPVIPAKTWGKIQMDLFAT